jgi:hypothetical protein
MEEFLIHLHLGAVHNQERSTASGENKPQGLSQKPSRVYSKSYKAFGQNP